MELTSDSVGTCFVHATRNLAAERPTVLLIDDLHFATEEARGLFMSVALAVPEHRVLVVGTLRPGMPENWVASVTRLDHASRMELIRLGPKDLMDLLRDSFASEELAGQLGVQIATKSDGNPFFAFEIIRGLREGQFISKRDDGTWASTRVIDEIQIPSSVLDLVNARVAGLSEDERALLDVAACWGYEFDPGLVGEVLGLARIPALRSFGQVERLHRLVRSSGRKYVFDHHQVQEALYGSLNQQLREEYHAALARALESRTKAAERDPKTLDGALCVDLCEHYLEGARGASALRYLPAAQEHLSKGCLNAQVAALTERALGVPDLLTGTERAKALLRLWDALDLLGRRVRQEECAREAERLAEQAGDDELRGQAAKALGTLFSKTSRHAEAEAAYGRALDLARARGDRKAEAGVIGNLGNVFRSQGRLAEGQKHYERSLALCREIGFRQGEAVATGNLGLAFDGQGRLREAQQYHERRLALARESGDRHGEAVATGNLGNVFKNQGRLAEAQEYHERCLALTREIGSRLGEDTALTNLGNVFHAQGRLPEAQEHHERSLAICREIGDRQGEAIASGNLGFVFQAQGRLPEARARHDRQLELSREIGYRQGEALARYNLASALLEEGEREGSEEQLVSCLALHEGIGDRLGEAWTRLFLGSLRAAAGDVDGGRVSLAAACDSARELGFPAIEVGARCELALLPGGDAEDALAAYAAHEERLRADERREARLLLFRATGDRAHIEEAKRLLDEALARVPEEYREAMRRNRRVNREILAAWREEFGADDGSPTESPTRAG